MSVTERLMAPGEGTVTLTDDVPQSLTRPIRDLIYTGVGCHIVITPTPLDPTTVSDASMLAAAMFTGKIDASPSRTELSFSTLHAWLDQYTETVFTRTAGTPTNWVDDVLLNGLTRGTVSGGSNVTATFPAYAQTRLDILKAVAEQGGWEYEIRPDFSINAGTSVWSTTPTVVLTNKSEGPDATYTGLLGGLDDQFIDARNVTTKVVALGQGAGASIITGSATKTPTLKDKAGNTPTLVSVVNAPTASTTTNANAIAAAINTAAAPSLAMQILTQYVRSQRRSGTSDAQIIQRLMDKGRGPGAKGETVNDGINWANVLDLVSGEVATRQQSAAAQQFAATTVNTLGATSTAGPGGSESQFVRRILRAGDYVYVYDLESGLVNTSTQITYRGEVIFPQTKRILSLTWAIEAGFGVYVRSNAATPIYYELTPYMAWEDPGAAIEVGDRPAVSYSSIVNRTSPDIEERVNSATGGTYTPTLVGMAIGTGGSAANTAKWSYSDGVLTLDGAILFGTTGTTFPGASITASLPSGFTAMTPYLSVMPVGMCALNDFGVTTYSGVTRLDSTTTVRFVAQDASGTYLAHAVTGTTIPFTWGAGDGIYWHAEIQGTFS
jgi:hypothetical protein